MLEKPAYGSAKGSPVLLSHFLFSLSPP